VKHGGRREGAGKKPKLTSTQAISVGLWCERLWGRAAEAQAMRNYEERSSTEQISQAQSRADLIPPSRRMSRATRESLEDISDDIDDATGGNRLVSIPLTRPYRAHEKVMDAAVRRCAKLYEISITRRTAKECWDKARALEARLRRELP
jgi:hypothetical protein